MKEYASLWRYVSILIISLSLTALPAKAADKEGALIILRTVKAPVVLQYAGMLQDGGTIDVLLTDDTGRQLGLSLDGHWHVMSLREFVFGGDNAPRQLYLSSGTVPAVAIAVSSAEEKQILALLQEWKRSGGLMGPTETGKYAPPPDQQREAQRKLMGQMIEILQKRN